VKITGDHQFTYRTFRLVCLDAVPRRRLLQGIGAVGLLMILAFGYESDRLFLLFGFALCLTFPELIALLSWYPQRHQAGGVSHYEIDDTGIRVRTATSDVSLTWSGMTWIKPQRHAWMIRHGMTQLPIPRAAFSPEDQAALDAFVTERVPTKA
jgi:hypothetical protein